jgi:hypothetical protein
MIHLGTGRRWWAALAGVTALLFAMCAVGDGLISPGYHLWLVCVLLLVFPALRMPSSVDGVRDASDFGSVKRKYSTRRRLLCLSLAVPPLLGIVLFTLKIRGADTTDWLDDPDPFGDAYSGVDARLKIVEQAGAASSRGQKSVGLPASAKDFWFYYNGFLSKSSEYCKFTCGSRDDCLKAVEAVGGVSPADLKPWKLSKYVAVMEGTAYRFRGSPASPKLHGNPWDVRGIKNGVVYEHAQLG